MNNNEHDNPYNSDDKPEEENGINQTSDDSGGGDDSIDDPGEPASIPEPQAIPDWHSEPEPEKKGFWSRLFGK